MLVKDLCELMTPHQTISVQYIKDPTLDRTSDYDNCVTLIKNAYNKKIPTYCKELKILNIRTWGSREITIRATKNLTKQ